MTMIIELANVGIRPKAIELTLSPDEIELDVDGVTLVGDVKFAGETAKIDDKVHVWGKVTTNAEIACVRCLEPVSQKFEIEFDDIFVDAADEPSDDELVLEGEDLDQSFVIDGKIDLAEVVREQLLLELPEQLVCREDCKGLCPKCGSNRNLIDCRCYEDEIDPRWSALKDLR